MFIKKYSDWKSVSENELPAIKSKLELNKNFEKVKYNSHLWHNPNCDILEGHLSPTSFITYGIDLKSGNEFMEYYSGDNYSTNSKGKRSNSRHFSADKIPSKYKAQWELLKRAYEEYYKNITTKEVEPSVSETVAVDNTGKLDNYGIQKQVQDKVFNALNERGWYEDSNPFIEIADEVFGPQSNTTDELRTKEGQKAFKDELINQITDIINNYTFGDEDELKESNINETSELDSTEFRNELIDLIKYHEHGLPPKREKYSLRYKGKIYTSNDTHDLVEDVLKDLKSKK